MLMKAGLASVLEGWRLGICQHPSPMDASVGEQTSVEMSEVLWEAQQAAIGLEDHRVVPGGAETSCEPPLGKRLEDRVGEVPGDASIGRGDLLEEGLPEIHTQVAGAQKARSAAAQPTPTLSWPSKIDALPAEPYPALVLSLFLCPSLSPVHVLSRVVAAAVVAAAESPSFGVP